MASLRVPLNFGCTSRDFEEKCLKISQSNGLDVIEWSLLNIRLISPPRKYYYRIGEIEKANGGFFKNWDLYGFSAGSYHEFFCYPDIPYAILDVAGFEVTFGQPSPLAYILYDGQHEEHMFGEWDNMTTVRLLGPSIEQVEVTFINAAVAYAQKFSVLPKLMQLDYPDDSWEEGKSEDEIPEPIRIPAAASDLLPLRLLYSSLIQVDATAACVNLYIILEHYAFQSYTKEISILRHDGGISDEEFSKRVIDIAYKEERGPILRLVNIICDDEILSNAVRAKLIRTDDKAQLGVELYAFRNSIVHGKQAGGYVLEVSSILSSSDTSARWRPILRALAERAMQRLSRKLIP